ncbi:hypothetical protein ScPMuIL_014842 [Solemya velum]
MDERKEALGFAPQKEVIYNKLLPYSSRIDEESTCVLAEIKGELSRAIQLRDVKVGAGHWNGQLTRYIRMYGHNFSKADHLTLVHLMFELTTIPDLELSLVQKYANQLIHLLKKKELLSREDLMLPWKPLYDLVESVIYSACEPHGLQLFPTNIENTLKHVVRSCRVYFSLESTQEMLEEWRPLLCPFDITIMKGLAYLELFLPTQLGPDHSDRGFKLWFDELINMWDSFHHSPSWECNLVALFSRLAHDSIGYIDWEPYISKVFNRFLRSFNLPVGTQAVQVGRTNGGYDIGPTLTWIVSMVGGGSSCQEHIGKLFQTLQSFFHPSNLGKWNLKLSGLLMSFPKMFSRRVYRERHKKPSWETPVPETHKLTDEEISRFVASMKPVVFTAMFSKYGSHDSAVALRHLANMRPEIIVPTLLEKMYPAMETLTEPHRLIACMNCMVSVTRPMLRAGKWYPEGPSHVLPLLNLSLPGIDPNDCKKTLVTFQMISTFVSMVPFVDCSGALHVRTDLTENERELCSATVQFEDFVLQFIDRIFALIENSSMEHEHVGNIKLNPEQSMLEVGMASTFTSVLQQCSTPIYQASLDRLYNFVTGSLFEVRVGGRFAANLCRAAAKVNPEAALKKFIPYFCNNIKNMLAAHPDIVNEEQLDNSFMWNLLMLSQVVRCDGAALVNYKHEILEVLVGTLHLKCVQGYETVGQMLRYILRALTMYYPCDFRSISGSLDRPFSDYLAIRDWAAPGDIDNLQIAWHEPSEEEMAFATQVVEVVLKPELEAISKIPTGTEMPREELLQRLTVITEVLLGAGVALPMWKGEPISIMESMVSLRRFHCVCSNSKHEIKLDGKNVKTVVIDAVRPLLLHMMSSCEDDIKNLFQLLKIYEILLFFTGIHKVDFDGRWKSFHMVKAALEDKVRGGKKHIRALLVDRIVLQHELRILNSNDRVFTEKHRELFEDMLKLSISRYSEVRKKAQSGLIMGFNTFPFSYRCLLPEIIRNVEDPNVPEHQFKGALHIIQMNGKRNLAMKRSWEIMQVVWPAIVKAQHSEKPSILKVIDGIIHKVAKNIETTAIKMTVTDSAMAVAGKLLDQTEKPVASCKVVTPEDLLKGVEFESNRNSKSEQIYHQLVNQLIDLVEKGNLNWKFSQIGMECLSLLLREDIAMPVQGIQLFVKTLVHDSLYMRKLAIGSVSAIFKQQKRKHKMKSINPYKLSKVPQPGNSASELRPGSRPDNELLLYDSKALPVTKEMWDSFLFVEKTHWGYYTWPVDMKIYAPAEEQPKVDRSRAELQEGEVPIYDAFMNADFVDKLLNFISMEEHKGRDKFRNKHMTLFKGLFRNYGDTFLQTFKPYMEKLIQDTSHDKHETKQRCAMEMLSGLLRGTKHWPYDKINAVWDWAIPLIKSSLSNITVETIDDWGTFFSVISESRDPRRCYRLFELMMDSPLSGEGGSFGDSSRLYALQSALAQQEWRIPEIIHRLLEYLLPNLSHQYKNVRDRIGSILSNIFLYDYQMHPGCQNLAPKRNLFIEQLLPQLEPLKDIVENETNGNGTPSNMHVSSSNSMETLEQEESNGEDATQDNERKIAIRLFKTVLKWLSNSFGRLFLSAPPELFAFLPHLCTLENETKDTELKAECSLTLACMSQAYIQPEVLPVTFHTIKEIAGLQSWHAREAVLGYLQVMVFCNFFTLHKTQFIHEVKSIVLHLICDDQLEVRQMASVTLSGLLHCGFLELDKDLIEHFEKLSRTKLKKRKNLSDNFSIEAIIRRHAGVLGLCGCVQAFPYTVPINMPQILMVISDHVNDPQPIQLTVKKTLSDFRRTHHDNWHDHKQMFTDDQLVVLTDLLVSPNYYA